MKKRRTKRNPIWYLSRTVLFIIICVGLMSFSKGIYKIWRLSRIKHSEERMLDDAVNEKKCLEHEIKSLQEDSLYIEEIAREEYGMIKKGEEVLQITLPDTADGEKNDDR